MFKKICFSPESNVESFSEESVKANPDILKKFTKLAKGLKDIAPKSDDFLYFSIIFLKAAESALLDENGKIKKVGSEDAWGFFDENWRWHGNVKPHRNNNLDIFPESQLKLATPLWIGKPLCRDHESSSVDGIRGVILDTYYDEQFKQVVGFCALDRANYPDLASKVESGLVRFGSMGTAVATSICTECGNQATNQNEYCQHVNGRTAHGEINVGLKPIEYSLVVQPAEPGAILLKCIASLNKYKEEFVNYGVKDVHNMLGKLSEKQAQHLDNIMKTACGANGCSISERKRIVTSFLENNGLLKSADLSPEEVRNLAEAAKVANDPKTPDDTKRALNDAIMDASIPEGESFTSGEPAIGSRLPGDVQEFSSASSRMGLSGGGDTGNNPDFSTERDPFNYTPSGEAAVAVAALDEGGIISKESKVDNIDNLTISSILEDIMNRSRMKKRAELRRKIAYMQGGSEGREPTYTGDQPFSFDHDKHMHQDKGMGGDSGMFPGDSETKEKLSRAELKRRMLRRQAYMQGGSEGREPAYTGDQPFSFDHDKHMHQDKGMGGDSGMFPGDSETKEKLSRARANRSGLRKSAYNGPSLSTRFLVKTKRDGSVDRANSVFQVFAGDKRVITATASEIFGPELNSNWNWLRSREYGKEVCRQIRTSGLNAVAGLLKSAQELPAAPAPDMGAPDMGAPDMGAPDMGAPDMGAPDMDLELPPLEEPGDELGEEEEEEEDPAVGVDNRLAEMETLIDEVRNLVDQMKDQRTADVDVNVFTGKEGERTVDTGMTALSAEVLRDLRVAKAKLDNSADELAMIGETYENITRLSSTQARQFKKLAGEAIRDADQLTGEVKGLCRFASTLGDMSMGDDHNLVDDFDDSDLTDLDDTDMDFEDDLSMGMDHADVDDLVASAMDLRRSRREAILKQAEDRVLSQRSNARKALLKKAEDMTGHVHDESCADDHDEDMAMDHDESMAMDHDESMGMDHGDLETAASAQSTLKRALAEKVQAQKEKDAREAYRIKLRRAYDVGLEMQRKGLLSTTKVALDKQVDEIMDFDDRAFESFKRSIASAKPARSVKIASDLGGVNIGVEDDSAVNNQVSTLGADALASLWD